MRTGRPRRIPYTGPERTPKARPHRPHVPARPDGLGIDLGAHYNNIRSMVRGFYGKRCAAHDIDPEDLIGVVCEAILRSNQGEAPYDPSRASLTRYLHILAGSRLSHMVEAAKARARVEQVGLRRTMGGEPGEGDAAQVAERYMAAPDPDDKDAREAAELVGAALDELLPEVQDEDLEDEESLVAFYEGTLAGWREEAVRWLLEGVTDPAVAARRWGVPVCVASDRLEWAKVRWLRALSR